MPKKTLASQYLSSHFAGEVADTFPIRVQCSLILSALLELIGFHEIVERWCGDDGEVPVSKVLEAYVHCRVNSAQPVPLSRFQDWVSHALVPVLIGVPAEKLNECRLGRVLEAVGPVAQGMWGEIIARAYQHFKFDLSGVINDTTAFYFEGEYERSAYAKYGHSPDNKPDCKQIKVNLNLTERDSIPVLYNPLAGNTADS